MDHLATVTPESNLGFSDTHYAVEVEENVLPNTLVKTLSIINKPKGNFQFTCEIISGNDANRFYVNQNEQRDCEVRVRDQHLDYEKQQKYTLNVRINGPAIAAGILIGPSKLIAQLVINIIDLNGMIFACNH